MYNIRVEVLNNEERTYTVYVSDKDDKQFTYKVAVSAKTMDQYDLELDDLPVVIENAFYFLLERESPSSILSSFELMTIATYFPSFSPGIDMT